MTVGSRYTAILDAAEQLFADHGFDGVSMRQVAQRAKVGLGLVTYHFPSKEGLFDQVVGRRAEALNEARREALAELDEPSLELLIATFFQPYRNFIETGDKGWRSYAKLHAVLSQDANWTNMVFSRFGGLAQEMIERLMAAEPALTREAAVRGYSLMIGTTVSVFSDTGLLDILSKGALSSHDLGGGFDALVRYASAGIRALARQDERPA
jgi:AcrR family transcriptional regulator